MTNLTRTGGVADPLGGVVLWLLSFALLAALLAVRATRMALTAIFSRVAWAAAVEAATSSAKSRRW